MLGWHTLTKLACKYVVKKIADRSVTLIERHFMTYSFNSSRNMSAAVSKCLKVKNVFLMPSRSFLVTWNVTQNMQFHGENT